jgi:transcriptional regulator with XRE-family HTH domain
LYGGSCRPLLDVACRADVNGRGRLRSVRGRCGRGSQLGLEGLDAAPAEYVGPGAAGELGEWLDEPGQDASRQAGAVDAEKLGGLCRSEHVGPVGQIHGLRNIVGHKPQFVHNTSIVSRHFPKFFLVSLDGSEDLCKSPYMSNLRALTTGGEVPEILGHHRFQIAMDFRGVSREDLAERLGVHPNTISNWANGHTKPATAMVEMIALVLEIDLAWLRDGDDSPKGGPGADAERNYLTTISARGRRSTDTLTRWSHDSMAMAV